MYELGLEHVHGAHECVVVGVHRPRRNSPMPHVGHATQACTSTSVAPLQSWGLYAVTPGHSVQFAHVRSRGSLRVPGHGALTHWDCEGHGSHWKQSLFGVNWVPSQPFAM